MTDGLSMRLESTLLLLGRQEIEALLDLPSVVATQRAVFTQLESGTAQLGARTLLPNEEDGSIVFSYAARLNPAEAAVCKFGSVVPGNKQRGLPIIAAIVVALHPETGRPVAVLDGEAITNARTAAASVVAAQALAAPPIRRIGILGAGIQGRSRARAFAAEFAPSSIAIWSPDAEQTWEAALALSRDTGGSVVPASAARAAVTDADIVITCTHSRAPILSAAWCSPGTTVISVGSFAPDRREVGLDLLAQARIFVDHVPTATVQAGPIIEALRDAALGVDQIHSIGSVLVGRTLARTHADQLVFYNSVGLGVQDAALTGLLLSRAAATEAGRHVDL
jgi:ornithine cyclodeaminase/alanine dehydrogenase-like protein (mu-crystallin family)